jgi:hypothetical protein
VEKVRRRSSFPKLRVALASALALFLILVVALSVKRYREPEAAPPEALAHIAEKNRDAAIAAAARQRTESAASTNAVEALAEARNGAEDNAARAGAHSEGNHSETAGRRD